MIKLNDEDTLLEIIRRTPEPWHLYAEGCQENYGHKPIMGEGAEWDAFMSGLVAAHGILMMGRHRWWE